MQQNTHESSLYSLTVKIYMLKTFSLSINYETSTEKNARIMYTDQSLLSLDQFYCQYTQ